MQRVNHSAVLVLVLEYRWLQDFYFKFGRVGHLLDGVGHHVEAIVSAAVDVTDNLSRQHVVQLITLSFNECLLKCAVESQIRHLRVTVHNLELPNCRFHIKIGSDVFEFVDEFSGVDLGVDPDLAFFLCSPDVIFDKALNSVDKSIEAATVGWLLGWNIDLEPVRYFGDDRCFHYWFC